MSRGKWKIPIKTKETDNTVTAKFAYEIASTLRGEIELREKEIETLKQQLTEKDKEIAFLKSLYAGGGV